MVKTDCFAYTVCGCRILLDCNCKKKGKDCPFYKTDRQIDVQTDECNKLLVGLGYALRKPYRVKK